MYRNHTPDEPRYSAEMLQVWIDLNTARVGSTLPGKSGNLYPEQLTNPCFLLKSCHGLFHALLIARCRADRLQRIVEALHPRQHQIEWVHLAN